MAHALRLTAAAGLLAFVGVLGSCGRSDTGDSAAPPPDDAQGRRPEDFPEIGADVFKPMDGGIALSADEIKGRNTWNLWCAGNEQLWDRMARESFGLMDLLKTLDSRKRDSRFKEIGLINQPGFRKAAAPDRFGLWIDEAVEPEPAGIDPRVYGRPSGVMGLRLFDNPEFDAEAQKKWDAARFYNDADDPAALGYSIDSGLVRPYRVGVSCGSCHITFNPCRPPSDPVNPKWENLVSALGNQYIAEGRVFANNVREGGLFAEMLKLQPRGTSDTSRIATDHINNPNAINPIFLLGARLSVAHEEELAGETRLLPTVTQSKMPVPHVLKDGADSVGVVGATLRVYVNIGLYSQHWLQQHNKLVGLREQKPFSIKAAQENSVYWRAMEQKFQNVGKFFTRIESFRLEDAPGGKAYLTSDAAVLERGKIAFADNCASCHSSKRPPAGLDEAKTRQWFRASVLAADFRDGNFFSDDDRKPVTEVGTNAGRACGTNAKRGHVWSNFSSETYKNLPSVGQIDVWNPYAKSADPSKPDDGAMERWTMPSGGPGYYRTPSLVSLWTSAPFLHNNALGKYTGDPSVAGRMEAFDDAVRKLLWPNERLDRASVWRTTRECDLQLAGAAIPEPLRTLLKPHFDDDGFFRIGPIPEGTPVNLLANIGPEMGAEGLAELALKVKVALAKIKLGRLDSAAAKELLRKDVAPLLFEKSNCPDLVEDRGHYYGCDEMSSDEKKALIEFLKTL